jgi:predicted DCC family thiol-disulfide oxidoreductase YuxK
VPPTPPLPPGVPVVLYDGTCGLCSRLVRFVLERDARGEVRFAALQSRLGRSALESAGLSPDARDTMVLFEDGAVHLRSTAALRLVRRLRAPWPLLYPFVLVPRVLRDALYDRVARHRHDLFAPSCLMPDPRWAGRFLDEEDDQDGRRPT